MKLRNEFCPIHKSVSCCGRERLPRPRLIRLGVQRVEDPHHPRGYRELRSPAEMRKLMNRKVLQQGGICAICHEELPITTTSYLTTRIRKEWAARGETITRTISRQHTGGATKKKDQQEWNDLRPISPLLNNNCRAINNDHCSGHIS